MPRKRHQKSSSRSDTPLIQPRELSPAAQAIAQRLAEGGADYLKQNLVRTMIASAKLAEEAEFRDLSMDGIQTMQVTQRWLKKYDRRLEAADKKGSDAYAQVADDMRIEIISELATPAFRQEVHGRLESLMNRLMTGKDTKKLEIVMMLIPALKMKSIPWGLCGLILEIYGRTMQEQEDEQEVLDAVAEALKAQGEEKIDIFTALKNPDKLHEIGEKVFKNRPEFRQRAEKQVWDMLDAFENALWSGEVDLKLFSEEEILLPFQRIQAEYGESITQLQTSEKKRDHVFEIIRQALTEIMTPQRFRRFREDVEKTVDAWLHARYKWGSHLQIELNFLGGDQYEETNFFLAAFIGQISLMDKDQTPKKQKK